MSSMLNDDKTLSAISIYLKRHPERIIYGEWLIPVNIKRYKKDAWNKFYIFDIFDVVSKRYLRYDEYSSELKELNLLFRFNL